MVLIQLSEAVELFGCDTDLNINQPVLIRFGSGARLRLTCHPISSFLVGFRVASYHYGITLGTSDQKSLIIVFHLHPNVK